MNTQRSTLLVLATLLLALGSVVAVYAHANLIRSDPAANSVLPNPPHQVTLYFTEQLEPKLSGAEVYDTNGKEVDTGHSVSSTDSTVMIVSLPLLPSGVYTVSWHAISAVDGHHTSGSFSFGIGNVTIPTPTVSNAAYTFPPILELVERWINLLSDAVFVGGSVFILVVWNPTLSLLEKGGSDDYGQVSSRLTKLVRLSAILAIAGTVLLLTVEAMAASTSNSWADITATAYTIVTSTRLGEYWMFRLAFAGAALSASIILLNPTKPSNTNLSLTLIAGLVLSLSTSITSHSAAATNYYPAINLLSDWIHLVTVGAWVGGLPSLAIAIGSLGASKRLESKSTAEILRRFSSVAVICVGAIGITGIYNLLVEVGGLAALLSTPYGQIILVKLAIFAPMIGLGALNQFVIYNHVTQPPHTIKRTNRRVITGWLGRFRFSVRTEMTLGIVLLLVVSVLTASAPIAQTSTSVPTYQPTPSILRGYSIQGVNVTLKIFPLQAGVNHFEIDFTNPQGASITDVRSVFVKFKYLDKNIGVSTANATASPNAGQYSLDGTYLSFSGNWRAEVWAQRSVGYDIIVPFQFNVPTMALRISELPLSSDANPYGIAVDQNGTVWFAETGSSSLARYNPKTNTFNEFSLPQSGSRPFYITIDQKGQVWASETQYNQIVEFYPSTNSFKVYAVPTTGAVPGGLAVDSNGNVWFTEEIAGKIGRLDPLTGVMTEFQIPTPDPIPIQTVVDSHGTIWFTESKGGKIGNINPTSGTMNEFQPRNGNLSGPTGITASPDGSIWFTEHAGNRITKFDPQNQTFQSFTIPTAQAFPFGITYHAGRLWFVEHIANAIGNLDPATGTFSNFPIPNNSSDVQLLALDQAQNVWFTLPASNMLGALTPTTSTLQIAPAANNTGFVQLSLVAAIAVSSATIVAFIFGRRRMQHRAKLRTRVSR